MVVLNTVSGSSQSIDNQNAVAWTDQVGEFTLNARTLGECVVHLEGTDKGIPLTLRGGEKVSGIEFNLN